MTRVPFLSLSSRRNPQQKASCFSMPIAPPKLEQGGWGGAEPATSAEPRGQGCGWWQARSVEAYGPPLPMVGAQSHIQLLTQCIIITTNSPLKEIIIKMILADSRGNEERKVLIPYCPLMGTEDGQWAAARVLAPQLGCPRVHESWLASGLLQEDARSRSSASQPFKAFRKPCSGLPEQLPCPVNHKNVDIL